VVIFLSRNAGMETAEEMETIMSQAAELASTRPTNQRLAICPHVASEDFAKFASRNRLYSRKLKFLGLRFELGIGCNPRWQMSTRDQLILFMKPEK
jgi:hypothetical protein